MDMILKCTYRTLMHILELNVHNRGPSSHAVRAVIDVVLLPEKYSGRGT